MEAPLLGGATGRQWVPSSAESEPESELKDIEFESESDIEGC